MDEEAIERAAELLRAGHLVAFPTETVYGLGADASNAEAVAKIFVVKGRPHNHPVIVHIASADQLEQWVREIPMSAAKLAEAFWPGPLTIILKRAEGVLDALTGGQDTVGVRVPSHPVAQALLRSFGGAIAAPSANKFGRISPTTAEHVRADLGEAVECVLDGGASEVGIESTIVDLSGAQALLLRPGRITKAMIEESIGEPVSAADADAPRAPGTLATHYAPRTPMKVVSRREMLDALATHRGKKIAIAAIEVSVPRLPQAQQRTLPAAAALYARDLYARLRELDATEADLILVEAPPEGAAWAAVWDRLRRASHATRSGRGMHAAPREPGSVSRKRTRPSDADDATVTIDDRLSDTEPLEGSSGTRIN